MIYVKQHCRSTNSDGHIPAHDSRFPCSRCAETAVKEFEFRAISQKPRMLGNARTSVSANPGKHLLKPLKTYISNIDRDN